MPIIRQEYLLRGVHPDLVTAAKTWAFSLPFDVLITEGCRSNARQQMLYAQGRTAPGKIVTMAQFASQTAHGRRLFGHAIFGCAIDAVPCTGLGGQPTYSDDAAYLRMAVIAEQLGLTWGGRWTRFPDRPHFQWSAWRNQPLVPDDVPDFSDVDGGSSTV